MQHPKQEKTLVIIKPDGIQRSLIGEIIRRYERTGLKLLSLKMVIPTEAMIIQHYYEVGGDAWLEQVGRKARASYEKNGMKSPYVNNMENGRAVMMANAKYLSSGPVIAMIWQGNGAVGLVRKITGSTEPLTSDVGTIRGDLTLDSYAIADLDQRSVRNLIHASGTIEEAEKEIKIWFKKDELRNYRLIQEQILYDVNLDGFKE
ncbi:nucleoside-diphosphate kinase [Patescibacteria group bacterium]|nr:nucleoside-diphosphate kinase [Patescibacteria group bacterium]MBU1663631.1 nucleoside-diphosphate kinase [Patescibacteria group bacterium]MBU1933877.1 nucleoside-diphosphate kinase [Patescibacteria group bacterium]MBU2007762.1 nucleoside-diphosphate kinase [Patescibacteria group bacterium]MBU2233417.1 nucleoside-diphosphate kinase [Patescibacteria group bacterium]